MPPLEVWFRDALIPSWIPFSAEDPAVFVAGGLFLDSSVPNSIVSSISVAIPAASAVRLVASRQEFVLGVCQRGRVGRGQFLSVSLSVKGGEGFVRESEGFLGHNGEGSSEEPALERKEVDEVVVKEVEKKEEVRTQGAGAGAMNTTKHLWAGAVAAMVSRYWVSFLVVFIMTFPVVAITGC